MTDVGRVLLFVGLIFVMAGLVLVFFGRTNIPLGRLPGDIIYRGKNTTFYFPIVTSIVLSVVLSILVYVIGRFRH
jgi:hypothetical protein